MSCSLIEAAYSNSDVVTTQILLYLSTPQADNKILVVVEGDDDKKLYQKLFDEEQTRIQVSGGCAHFLEVLRNLNTEFGNKFIIIKDADFDRLNDVTQLYDNLFLTDGHDAEMMIFDDEFEKTLQNEFLDGRMESIIEKVIMDIRHLSYVKWYNQKHSCRVNMESLKPVQKIYNGSELIPVEKCLEQVYCNKKNQGAEEITKEQMESFEEDHPTEDYKNLTNGHDLSEGICRRLYFMNADQKGGKPGVEEICRLARTAFSLDRFKETKLFCSLTDWEARNEVQILRK